MSVATLGCSCIMETHKALFEDTQLCLEKDNFKSHSIYALEEQYCHVKDIAKPYL